MSLAEGHYSLPNFFGILAAMAHESYDPERFGRIIRARREDLDIKQDRLDDYGGPSSTRMSQLERGIGPPPSPKTLRKLDTGLGWVDGSAKRTLHGGDPEVLGKPLLRLPRDAPNAPVLGQLEKALGIHPNAPHTHMPLGSAERVALARVRNKLIGSDSTELTQEETELIANFVEDDELRSLHVRIDWLPRAEQLKVSELVSQLQLELERRWVAAGYTNESEQLPDYAQPNPLPIEGVPPDPQEFPPQVRQFTRTPESQISPAIGIESDGASGPTAGTAALSEDEFDAPPATDDVVKRAQDG